MKVGAHAADAVSVAVADPKVRPAHRAVDYLTLTKPRLNLLVLMTTLAGLYLAAPDGVPLRLLVKTIVGTALVAGGGPTRNGALSSAVVAAMAAIDAMPIASRLPMR